MKTKVIKFSVYGYLNIDTGVFYSVTKSNPPEDFYMVKINNITIEQFVIKDEALFFLDRFIKLNFDLLEVTDIQHYCSIR
jgi:hypothetical protein